jgi:hypothetical protein
MPVVLEEEEEEEEADPGRCKWSEEDGDEKAAATCFDKQSVKSQRWNTNLEKTFLVPSLLKSEK